MNKHSAKKAYSKEYSESPRYNAEIVAGALMLNESREIARLMLQGVNDRELKLLLTIENVLQKRSPATALRQAALIKKRLKIMTPDLWEIVVNESKDIATQSLLAASIKHSKLIGDFLLRVVKNRWLAYDKKLQPGDWESFIEECQQIDSTVTTWSDSTRKKLGQVVILSLVEGRYIESARSRLITPTHLTTKVQNYLQNHNEQYVLECMSIFE